MEGQEVVTSDDQKLGPWSPNATTALISSRATCSRQARDPREFLARARRRVPRDASRKDVVNDSPKVDRSDWDLSAVRLHYGLDGTFEVEPRSGRARRARRPQARARA